MRTTLIAIQGVVADYRDVVQQSFAPTVLGRHAKRVKVSVQGWARSCWARQAIDETYQRVGRPFPSGLSRPLLPACESALHPRGRASPKARAQPVERQRDRCLLRSRWAAQTKGYQLAWRRMDVSGNRHGRIRLQGVRRVCIVALNGKHTRHWIEVPTVLRTKRVWARLAGHEAEILRRG